MPFDRPVDTRPQAVAAHRRSDWPHMHNHCDFPGLVPIYEAVRATGLPNAMSARIPLPSNLNISAWEKYLGSMEGKDKVLDFVKFGFPTGYVGPTSDATDTPNHPSATNFPGHIDEFISKEIDLRGMVSPFDTPPFKPLCHVSPLMSREKGDTAKRRVITDMTYPQQKSINAYIVKNGVYGIENEHTLPTVEALADDLRHMGKGSYLSTIDVSRAYKNFVSDPLDWPLLCLMWREKYYCDLSMPFGARASSFHMQSIANCITDILCAQGIHCRMYLDDLIILSPNRELAWTQYRAAKDLLSELGLPEALDKAQPPAQRIKWLGVMIDSENMTLSIPEGKVATILHLVQEVHDKRYVSKKQLQSLLGQLLFVAKCVRPARVFVSHMLTALRNATSPRINIDDNFRADLLWFLQFCTEWNGVGVIPPPAPTKILLVDACLSGIGGTDGERAYGTQLAPSPTGDGARNITELEAMNVVVAMHTLLSYKDRGSHVRIRCDNEAATRVFSNGRAHNPVLQECDRAAWMVQALLGVEISYDHIPGRDNEVADALSRAHLGHRDQENALYWVKYYLLQLTPPCIFFMFNSAACLYSRSGIGIPHGKGGEAPSLCKGARNNRQSQVSSGHVRGIHGLLRGRPTEAVGPHGMCLSGVPGHPYTSPIYNQEQTITCTSVPALGRALNATHGPPQGQDGARGIRQEQELRTQSKTPTPGGNYDCHTLQAPRLGCGENHRRSSAYNVLRRPPTVGSHPPIHREIRQHTTSNQERRDEGRGWHPSAYKVGKEHAEGGTAKGGDTAQDTGLPPVPRNGPYRELHGSAHSGPYRPAHHDTRVQAPGSKFADQENMGCHPDSWGHKHSAILATQSQKDLCYTGTHQGLYRGRDTETRGLEVDGIQKLYRHPNWQSHSRPSGLYC